jgi:hypothetical protein
MNELFHDLLHNKKSLLGAGPMSTNCINAVINISNKYNIPIQLIASRRQIDSDDHGGGYVNNWSTEEFSNYVRKNSQQQFVFLSRDHSGPWQGYYEVKNNLDLKSSMNSCKRSLEEDIDQGFKFLHLDPCIDINNQINTDMILDRLFELYGHVYDYSKGLNDIFIEVGTDLQSDQVSSVEETRYILDKVTTFSTNELNHKPTFFVIQNGTKVLETENIGEYKDKVETNKSFIKHINELTTLINSYGLLSKAHNCDYLNLKTLKTIPKSGINGVNIAPEYGVAETKEIINLCKNNYLEDELNEFYSLSYESGKWEKWLKPESKLSKKQKAILSGHYIFSSEEFKVLASKINFKLEKKGINFNNELYNAVYSSIRNSLDGLNW